MIRPFETVTRLKRSENENIFQEIISLFGEVLYSRRYRMSPAQRSLFLRGVKAIEAEYSTKLSEPKT